MRKFSKKFIVRGVRFCTPLLLLLVMVAVTSLARARPAKAASDFKTFCWEDRKELKKHLSNDKDSNGIEYNKYGFEVNTGADDHWLRISGSRNPINLKQRCDGKVHDDPKEENKPPYRYWFWVKGNKLRSSGIHWSTDGFVATTKPLTGSYNIDQYARQGVHAPVTRYEVSRRGGFIASKGRDLTINGAKWGISFYVIDLNSKLLFLHF